jgi:hypothetical protein
MKISKKPLNNRGFSHVEILLLLVVIAVVAGAGFFVFKHQNKAHAAAWTTLAWDDSTDKSGQVSAKACKVVINSGYGQLYKATFFITNTSTKYRNIIEYVARPSYPGSKGWNRVSSHNDNTWWYGVWASVDVLASVPLKDAIILSVAATAGDPSSGWGFHNPNRPGDMAINPQYLANC